MSHRRLQKLGHSLATGGMEIAKLAILANSLLSQQAMQSNKHFQY